MGHTLVLMGSGETTPTMVETHKRVFAALGDAPDAVILDTPYGFQENASEISERTVAYFRRSVGQQPRVLEVRDTAAMSAAELGRVAARIETADWVYAGPGSPTYLRRQWADTAIPDAILRRMERPGATVFASAAVCSVGARTLPVYEIYKVGERPRWDVGFDVVATLGLPCVVIPHFDNAEGGTHDTRYCYLGERRLRRLEQDLPDDTWVLGIDEHTALLVDVGTGDARIEGRGVVTVRAGGHNTTLPAGTATTTAQLQAAATGRATTATADRETPPVDSSPADGGGSGSALLDDVTAHQVRFDRCLSDGDAVGAAEVLVDLEATIHAWRTDVTQSDEMDRARRTLHRLVARLAEIAQSGLHDHRDLVAPLVEELLDLRQDARADRDYATGDRIRDTLVDAGVEVRDTADGAAWEFDDPVT